MAVNTKGKGAEKNHAGRIVFRLRFGVTGHRSFDPGVEPYVVGAVKSQIERVSDWFGAAMSTPVKYGVVSQLADGADRIVVRAVFEMAREKGHEARLEAVLPMPPDQYCRIQGFSRESREEFEQLLKLPNARLVGEAQELKEAELGEADGARRTRAYAMAGLKMIERCDVLLAIWDGKASGGLGGTADTLAIAAAQGVPCIWVPVGRGESPMDNLASRSEWPFFESVVKKAGLDNEGVPAFQVRGDRSLAALKRSAQQVERFNRAILPTKYQKHLEARLSAVGTNGKEAGLSSTRVRASVLSKLYRREFEWATRLLVALAFGATLALAVDVGLRAPRSVAWTGAILLVLSIAVFRTMQEVGMHDRWLVYRALAERLKIAEILDQLGVDFARASKLLPALVEPGGASWVVRAFEEVWHHPQRRRNSARRDRDWPELQRMVYEWIRGQCEYHAGKVQEERKRYQFQHWTAKGLGLATVACAFVLPFDVGRNIVVTLLLAFPAAAGAFGALLVLRQDHAIWKRSESMVDFLTSPLLEIERGSSSPDVVRRVAEEAAERMLEENESWLGTLWFVDVESLG